MISMSISLGRMLKRGTQLDYLMDFSVLCEEGTDRFCTYNSVTPRLMFDISPNSPWNVVYELGEFWHENEELMGMCSDNMNSTWWHDEETLRDSMSIQGISSITTWNGYYVQIAGVVIVVVVLLVHSVWKKCSDRKGMNEGIISGGIWHTELCERGWSLMQHHFYNNV